MSRAAAITAILCAVSSVARAGGGQPVCAAVSISVDVPGNGVLEADETVAVVPSWMLASPYGGAPQAGLYNFSGPTGGGHTIVDGAGFYVLSSFLQPTPCSDCYAVRVSATTRPVQHWDATVDERLLNPASLCGEHTWRLHVGNTFADVPTTSPFYRFVETIVHKNVTGGCASADYCPAASISREGMAVFLLVAREPAGYQPVACGATPAFADVPVSSPFCRWVEELARRGIVGGCGAGNYCPSAPVTREEMAVFLLAGGATPPPCVADPFLDVPVASPFCRWIRQLVTQGITSGCGNGNYCPAAPVTREQMSVFLTTRFALTLYGL